MTELLSIPFKSSVDADIAKPLKTLISSKYTGEDEADHSEAVAEFQKYLTILFGYTINFEGSGVSLSCIGISERRLEINSLKLQSNPFFF